MPALTPRKKRGPPPPPPKSAIAAAALASAAPMAPLPNNVIDRSKHPRWRKMHARMLKKSLALYATEVLRGPEEYGGKFMLGPHHIEWSEALTGTNRILALAARDHGKSFFWTFAYPLWMIDRVAPGKIGYIFSASDSQAKDLLDKIRNEIIGGGEGGGPNPKLAHLLPLKKDSQNTIKFANNSEIRARGFGTKVRGGHPWWAVADDIGNDEWIYSQLVRSKAIDYFLSAIRPMVVPGGQLIVVGTPFHALDLYDFIEKTGAYKVMKHPALVDGKALWPKRYGVKALKEIRKELGSELRFSREYLCVPISDDSSLFPSHLFEAPGVKVPYALGVKGWEGRNMRVFAGVDLAISSEVGADYLVVFVMAVDAKGNRWIVDIIRRKGLGYKDQVDLIINTCRKYEVSFGYVEANQFQRVISDMVLRESDIPIKAIYTTGKPRVTGDRKKITQKVMSENKHGIERGVPMLRMRLESGKFKIPYADENNTRETIDQWIGEMQSFGFADGKVQSLGAHDDTVMACWICDLAVEYGSRFGFDFMKDLDEETKFKQKLKMPAAGNWRPKIEDSEIGMSPADGKEPDFFGTGFGIGDAA